MGHADAKDNIEPVYFTIGQLLRLVRQQRGWSSKMLGAKLGLVASAVTAWENGLTRVKLSTVILLADIYEVPIDKFVALLLSELKIEDCLIRPHVRATRARIGQRRSETVRKRKEANANKRGKKQ